MVVPSSEAMIEIWLKEGQKVTELDPLKIDEKIRVLHLLNTSGQTNEIIQLLYNSLPTPDVLDQFGYSESLAAMRDLGIFIGILKKHGIEPVEEVPELEYVLLVLMVKTNLPPRDTLIHYTIWNPSGERIRTYTGLQDEIALIDSVRMAMPGLMRAIAQLDGLEEATLNGLPFEAACHEVREKIEGMVHGIVHARKTVSPAIFANELRFYYDPIKVDYNKDYIGPGAVEMPMFVFDHLLWSSDCTDQTYRTFKEGYLPYNMPFIRDIYWRWNGKPSLVSKVISNLESNPSQVNLRAATNVLELTSVLKSFRMPHKKVAESAYSQNSEQHHTKGSGGYSTDILQHIINLQNDRLQKLQQAVMSVKERVNGS